MFYQKFNYKSPIIVPLLLSAMMNGRAFAGTANFTGYAETKTEPDYIQLSVTVVSECFPTASAVSDANDDVGNNVIGILEQFKNPNEPQDKVIATGGYVERYTGHDPATRTNYCVNSFRKINTITLRTSSVATFGRDFSKIQDTIYGLALNAPLGRIEIPMTYLTMGTPQTALRREHFEEIKLKTISAALENAIEKFKVTFAATGIFRYLIKSYQEVGGVYPSPARDYVAAPESGDGGAAPVRFDDMTISSQVQVEFEY